MALALYRRYRPDTFAEVIGQDQVTVPLSRALDEGRLTHAYLFSGPRGCGKTSSARILARCANCAKGPTSHPCGECDSCRDLATGGPGSLDVVEIDAASHNGVDDARELRERAGFAPARDRFKIFILDEAHMVTQQGFNALLKIVEEPPEHVMFIFATTEPDKVIGTIRSRTHHYPFRLVPPEVMGPYLKGICAKEGVTCDAGVLRMVMRAGGGSVRDTLSVLDQLMAGADGGAIDRDSAVALLGFTPEPLIGRAVDAVIASDGAALYDVVEKVVAGGFDPRRFVGDLLARVRDLLVLRLGGAEAERALGDETDGQGLDELRRQAGGLEMDDWADLAGMLDSALAGMAGTVSPRMKLELLAARLLSRRDAGVSVASDAMPAGREGDVRARGFVGSSRRSRPATATRSPASAPVTIPRDVAPGAAYDSRPVAPSPATTGGAPTASSESRVPTGATSSTIASESVVSRNSGPDVRDASLPAAAPASPAAESAASSEPARGPAPAATVPQWADLPARASSAPASDDVDARWDSVVAGLPGDVGGYVDRRHVPRVSLSSRPSGGGVLALTFDCALSQHAFALAVAPGGVKAARIVLDGVHRVFGDRVTIAPTPVAANGERVEKTTHMPPEELSRIKRQIALDRAHQAAGNLAVAAYGQRTDDRAEPAVHSAPAARETRSHSSGEGKTSDGDDVPAHREPSVSPRHARHAASDDGHARASGSSGMANPGTDVGESGSSVGSPANPSPGPSVGSVPVSPPMSTPVGEMDQEEMNAWFTHIPPAPAGTAGASGVGHAMSGAPLPPPSSGNVGTSSSALGRGGADGNGGPGGSGIAGPPRPGSPWSDSRSPLPTDAPSSSGTSAAGSSPSEESSGHRMTPESQGHAWPASGRPLPGDEPGVVPEPEEDIPDPEPPEDDDYSLDDRSLGDASEMSLEELSRIFDVQRVERYESDDPRNPLNPANPSSDSPSAKAVSGGESGPAS